MNNAVFVSLLEGQVLLLAIGMTRLTTAFVLLPLFSAQLIPGLVRNSIFVSLTLIILSVHAPIDTKMMSSAVLIRVFAVEVLLGVALGFLFGIFLWAFEAAGEVIDTAIGTSMAMIHDPISGNEVTLFGEFLSRWVNYLFMASGGMIVVTGILLDSYAFWPIGQPLPEINIESVETIQREFTDFFALTLMLAAPFIVIIFLVDLSMGLVNRFAQQLNVLFLSISIKSILSLIVMALLLPSLTETFLGELEQQADEVMLKVNALFL